MLRPATPLSVMLLVAFVFMLLSVLSVPVTKLVPLGKVRDVTFGVFGYCQADGSCSPIRIGYDAGTLPDNTGQAFELPAGVRNNLSAILVVHPVAALLILIMLIMALAAHVHAPSRSTRYLLILFIFTVITFVICLLAFLVDVLLFIPNLAWGSYIVLAATILMALSAIVSCAMRRMLLSRKSHKKRVEENAEMSGENYYSRAGQAKLSDSTTVLSNPPIMGGASSGPGDKLPIFASFPGQSKNDQISDEQIPLTQARRSETMPNTMHNDMANAVATTGFNNATRSPIRDRFGHSANPPMDDHANARPPPADVMNRRGRGDMALAAAYRGGRPGDYGRAGYDQFGAPMRGRGGYGPPPARGSPRGARPAHGRPRGGYGLSGIRGAHAMPPNYSHAVGPYERRPHADAFGPSYGYPQPPERAPDPAWSASKDRPPPAGYGTYDADGGLPRAESPPPLPGDELGASLNKAPTAVAEPPTEGANLYSQFGDLRDNDADVVGMVGLQQARGPGRPETYMTEGSVYSTDAYIPPRTAWNQNFGRDSPGPSRLNIEAYGRKSPPVASPQASSFYDDVEPRFATPLRPSNLAAPAGEAEYEDVHATMGGARSPTGSERSNFTSVSQRGVNPRWNPHPPLANHQGLSSRRLLQQQRQGILLDNPDFQLPHGGRGRGLHRGVASMTPGSAYPTGPF